MASTTEHAIESRSPDTHAFEVRSGTYSGVTQELAEGRYVVGSGDGSDLTLIEPGLAPRHAAIVLLGARVRVEGLAEGVSVAGAGPVPPGSARTVGLPASVEIGGVEIAWRERAPETRGGSDAIGWPTATRARFGRTALPGIATAAILAAALLPTFANPIAGTAALLHGSAREALQRAAGDPAMASAGPAGIDAAALSPAPDAAPSQASAMTQPVGFAAPAERPTRPAGRPNPALAPQAESAVRTAASALEREARAAGLLNVHVTAGTGAVTAAGYVEPAMSGRWEALQQGFDERFVGEITLVNSVAVKAEKLPASLGIEGVWRGTQPYIVMRGQRYFVGAVVDGGWAIRAIEHDRVMLEREGRLVAMRF